MNAHFEIVTTDADQPHHVRVIGDNGEPLMTSENLEHMVDAERVVLLLAQMFGAFSPEIPRPHNDLSHVFGGRAAVAIVYRDERTPPEPGQVIPPAEAVTPATPKPPRKRSSARKTTSRRPRKTAARKPGAA